MNELPVGGQTTPSSDEVDLRAIRTIARFTASASRLYLVELVVLAFDMEVSFAFVDDFTHWASHVNLFS